MTYYKRDKQVFKQEQGKKCVYDFKISFKLLVAAGVALITYTTSLLFTNYLIALVPALIAATMLLGATEHGKAINITRTLAVGIPVTIGAFRGEDITQIGLYLLAAIIVAELSNIYRSFVWKKSVILGDLPLWTIILFLAVTNEPVTPVFLISVLLNTVLTTVLIAGAVTLVRAFLLGEEVHKWVKNN